MAEAARTNPADDPEREFRNALGAFATGVTVVTARDTDGTLYGLTVNSFAAVSLQPRLILWSQISAGASASVFEAARYFAVNVLAADQIELSRRFAKRTENKFAGLQVTEGLGGAPLLAGTAACFECEARERFPAGDHVIRLGEVLRFQHSRRSPLLFARGRYQSGRDIETNSDADADIAAAWAGLS